MNMQNVNDNILKAQAGDADAEAELLQKYARLVKSVAFSYYAACADCDIEDLVQVGMIALMRAVRTYNVGGEASFETYATHCVRNGIIDELRKTHEPFIPLDDEIEAPQTSSIDFLSEAIASILTPAEMRVLELRLEAFSYAEIAAELGFQKKKVDNLIASARRKLRKFLDD